MEYTLTCLQHNCDPRFFTTVVFYMGSVSMATQLKFEVFDVYDRRESKVIVCVYMRVCCVSESRPVCAATVTDFVVTLLSEGGGHTPSGIYRAVFVCYRCVQLARRRAR